MTNDALFNFNDHCRNLLLYYKQYIQMIFLTSNFMYPTCIFSSQLPITNKLLQSLHGNGGSRTEYGTVTCLTVTTVEILAHSQVYMAFPKSNSSYCMHPLFITKSVEKAVLHTTSFVCGYNISTTMYDM